MSEKQQLRIRVTNLQVELLQANREIARMREALGCIAHPISAMQKEADKKGYKLDGVMALQLSQDAGHLSGMARKALMGVE